MKIEQFYKDEIKELKKTIKQSNEVHNQIIESYEKEIKRLKEVIDKAIEYINKFENSPEYIDAFDITYWQDEVLDILKQNL